MTELYFSNFHVTHEATFFSKIVSTNFLLVCFLSLQESTCETTKNVFYFTSKPLASLCQRNTKFGILEIQISWRYQMPKHKTSKHGSKHGLVMKSGQFMSYYKRKLQPENQFQALLYFQRIKNNLYWKMKLLKQATYIRYVLAKLSKFFQISTQTYLNSFFTEDSLKIKKGLELVSRPHFS